MATNDEDNTVQINNRTVSSVDLKLPDNYLKNNQHVSYIDLKLPQTYLQDIDQESYANNPDGHETKETAHTELRNKSFIRENSSISENQPENEPMIENERDDTKEDQTYQIEDYENLVDKDQSLINHQNSPTMTQEEQNRSGELAEDQNTAVTENVESNNIEENQDIDKDDDNLIEEQMPIFDQGSLLLTLSENPPIIVKENSEFFQKKNELSSENEEIYSMRLDKTYDVTDSFNREKTKELEKQATLLIEKKSEQLNKKFETNSNSKETVTTSEPTKSDNGEYFDASLYPNETLVTSDLTSREPSASNIQKIKSNSQLYFDVSLYPNINPISEVSRPNQIKELKVNYFDSSLYPSKSPEFNKEPPRFDMQKTNPLEDKYLDSSLYPNSISNEIYLERSSTYIGDTSDKKNGQPNDPYYDCSLYPNEAMTEQSKTIIYSQKSAKDEYYDSSLYPNDGQTLVNKSLNKLTESSNESNNKTNEEQNSSISKYPYTKTPELNRTRENTKEKIESVEISVRSVSSLKSQTEDKSTNNQNLNETDTKMYNNRNDNFNNMNGNNPYNDNLNNYRNQQPPMETNQQPYYENETLNQLRMSNTSIQSNRRPSLNQQLIYKKPPQNLPPLSNDSYSQAMKPQVPYNPNLNGHMSNSNSYPMTPNNGYQYQNFNNQMIDPRTANMTYSGYGQPYAHNQQYDAISARRKLLNQMSANTKMLVQNSNMQSQYLQSQQHVLYPQVQYPQSLSSRRSTGYYNSDMAHIAYNGQNNGYSGSVLNAMLNNDDLARSADVSQAESSLGGGSSGFNVNDKRERIDRIKEETLASNNVDDLIDQMAKRRLTIKKLEVTQLKIEMSRQQTRTSALIRQSSQALNASDGQLNYSNPLNQSMIYNNVDTSINYDPRTATYSTRPPINNNYTTQLSTSFNYINQQNYRQNAETEQIYAIDQIPYGNDIASRQSAKQQNQQAIHLNQIKLPSPRNPNQIPVNLDKADLGSYLLNNNQVKNNNNNNEINSSQKLKPYLVVNKTNPNDYKSDSSNMFFDDSYGYSSEQFQFK